MVCFGTHSCYHDVARPSCVKMREPGQRTPVLHHVVRRAVPVTTYTSVPEPKVCRGIMASTVSESTVATTHATKWREAGFEPGDLGLSASAIVCCRWHLKQTSKDPILAPEPGGTSAA